MSEKLLISSIFYLFSDTVSCQKDASLSVPASGSGEDETPLSGAHNWGFHAAPLRYAVSDANLLLFAGGGSKGANGKYRGFSPRRICFPSPRSILFLGGGELHRDLSHKLEERFVLSLQTGDFRPRRGSRGSFGEPTVDGLGGKAVFFGGLRYGDTFVFDPFHDLFFHFLRDPMRFIVCSHNPIILYCFASQRLCPSFGGPVRIPEDRIVGFPLATEIPPCTDAEARGLVRFAKERGWKSLVIVVPPFHAVRAFVSTVSPAIREYPELKVYSHPSQAPSWTEEVMCFQGMPRGKRASFIPKEFEKMERYLATGSHLAPEEILAYLDRRDAQ